MVLVPGRRVGCDDCVPDDGFRGRLCGAGRGVDGFEVDKDLFGVPVEEAGKICGSFVSNGPLHLAHA